MSEERSGVRLVHDHEGGEIPDFHEVIWLGKSEYRDAIGRRAPHAWRRWAVLGCNNPGCRYEAVVSEALIVSLVAPDTEGSGTPDA